jgi:diphosphomevalonate decarboxylase
MMKATAIAPANIAFIKYWGRKDAKLRLPYNPSISMNLSACTTTTTVEFSPDFEKDFISKGFDEKRILAHIDMLRARAGVVLRVRISTKNSFPASAGIASSASGFAALTMAASAALGLKFSEKELTGLARLGSGSACRSIPDGFVKWDGEYAYSLYPPEYWDIRDILVVVDTNIKKISSSEGHDQVTTSSWFKQRLAKLPERIGRFEKALKTKNFQQFGEIIEEDCLDMHHVMQTQDPPLYYWNESTKQVLHDIKKSGIPAYFTIDAGPNVHIICEGNDEKRVTEFFRNRKIIVNKPARGAHLV